MDSRYTMANGASPMQPNVGVTAVTRPLAAPGDWSDRVSGDGQAGTAPPCRAHRIGVTGLRHRCCVAMGRGRARGRGSSGRWEAVERAITAEVAVMTDAEDPSGGQQYLSFVKRAVSSTSQDCILARFTHSRHRVTGGNVIPFFKQGTKHAVSA